MPSRKRNVGAVQSKAAKLAVFCTVQVRLRTHATVAGYLTFVTLPSAITVPGPPSFDASAWYV
jgi:hypothetical protein